MDGQIDPTQETIVAKNRSRILQGTPPISDPWIGKVLAGVRLESLLSEGGMGHVYTGWHEKEGRRVAIKIIRERMRKNPFFMRQFQKEANAIVALDHPGIVRCVDCRMEQGRPYFVMDLIEGLPLNEFLGAYSQLGLLLPLHIVERILQSVAAGLEHAHERGVLHLDIKPGNIMLQSDQMAVDPGGPIAQDLRGAHTDFGLARMRDKLQKDPQERFFMGTPGYASPELIRGEDLDTRSDVYSLGAVLYELLAGELPFKAQNGDPISVLRQHLTRELPPISGLSPEMYELLLLAMAKDPSNRTPSAMALADRFHTLVQ